MEKKSSVIISICLILIVLLFGVITYGYANLLKKDSAYADLSSELEATRASLAEKEAHILNLEAMMTIAKQEFALSEENGAELSAMLADEKNRNDDFENQIDSISGKIGTLDKLSKIDPELLIKYSRVYFLSENYKPEKTSEIDTDFLLHQDQPEYIHSKVADHLKDLLQDAETDDINLRVVSGYRSFDEQMGLKNAYTASYGYGANAFSADQGYSEHQLGTTIDFTTKELGGLTGFESTEAYAWLQKNAYKYGFVISYPKENVYYIFEPWHWRFVGEKLAGDLHDDDKLFYDLDQREIDKYLISIFD